ncbi:MAG TPA: hypothetical protein VH350_15070 [Candidatus Sulfotelmatobacter sp.]|jgi:hypothetical protein|nr:hypothetical protein [Candidatus Sulfotelmatobacter sp.]
MENRLAVFSTTWKSRGATPKYKVLLFNALADGNPEERFRVGDEGLRYCLESEYALGPDVVDSIFRQLVSSGEAEVSVEIVPA